MKILWVVNTILPAIAERCGAKSETGGGWLSGISDVLLHNKDIHLTVCFPFPHKCIGETGQLKYYSFQPKNILRYDKSVITLFKKILDLEKPDIIHIFGTEYPHTLEAIEAASELDCLGKVVISIQGLVSIYANHYYAGLPHSIIHKYTLRDFIKKDNLIEQRKSFIKRGRYEIAALKKVKHIIGRTEWDEACVKSINPQVKYHFCNETLRNVFYDGKWEYDSCEKHSIFLGSCSYPIKGFHCILNVLPEILRAYPDAKLYVPGQSPLRKYGLTGLIHKTYYQVYLKKLIEKNHLENNVVFLGKLSAEQMKERMLKSHVFILPSSIENSPNTLGEAMVLGLPCIASDVGGVSSMATHGKEAFLYPFEEEYMVPHYLKKIFDDMELQYSLSVNAQKKAHYTHSAVINNDRLMDIYKQILGKE